MPQGTVRTLQDVVSSFSNSPSTPLLYTETLHKGISPWLCTYQHTTQEEKERNLKYLVESLTKTLLDSFLSDKNLHNRYAKREALIVKENGEASLCVFSSTQNGRTYELTSSLLGVVIGITDLGQNFVFYAHSQAQENHVPHVLAEEVLSKNRKAWSNRVYEIIISTDNLSFSNESKPGSHFYGYSPHAIADGILTYIPKAKKEDFTVDEILASFHSDKNPGVRLFTLFGIDVFFRLNIAPNKLNPTDEEITTERYAKALNATDITGKILARDARLTAELVIRSSANFLDRNHREDFDYSHEQSNMKKLGGIICLGLSQWINDGCESLGKPALK